jgi:hypothetical protein
MNNKLLSYRTSVFHAQNVPVINRFRWAKFICALGSEEGSFETLPKAAGIPAVSSLNSLVNGLNDVLYVLTGSGILYADHAEKKIKPTGKTDQNFTWGVSLHGRTWFSGPGLGLWYAEQTDPYTIVQSNVTSGEFAGTGYDLTNYPFLSATGAYYYDSGTLKPYYGQIDCRYGHASLGFGGTEEGIWLIRGYPYRLYSSGNFYGAANAPDSSTLVFGEDIICRATPNPTLTTSVTKLADGINAYCGAVAQDNKLYLCTDAGIKRYNESTVALDDTDISSGLFHWCAVAEDGNLYFCGEDGVFCLDNDTGIISPLAETNEYLQCTLSDNKFYFRDGQNVKLFTIPHNTGASVAEELKLCRSKFGKETELETYSMLDYIQPHITVNGLRRMSQPDILQRAANLLEAVPKPARYTASPDAAYNPDSAEMCPVGEYGTVSRVIKAQVCQSFNSSQYNRWHFESYYLGGTGDYAWLWYIDNISFFDNAVITIIANTSNHPQAGSFRFGLIDYPPEEWNLTANSTESYNAARDKMAAATNKKTFSPFPNTANRILEIPVNEIYNGPNAKTLAVDPALTASMSAVSLYVNGEKWSFKLYRVCIFGWSDRVCQRNGGANTGNAIAKTLTLTVPTFGSKTFSILDAFGSYPAIDETAYAAMSDTAINGRATALMDRVAGLEGQTGYRKNNEVIEYNTAACPVT